MSIFVSYFNGTNIQANKQCCSIAYEFIQLPDQQIKLTEIEVLTWDSLITLTFYSDVACHRLYALNKQENRSYGIRLSEKVLAVVWTDGDIYGLFEGNQPT